MSEDEKQYFEWVPCEGAEEKEKIDIIDFQMNPISKYLDRNDFRGVNIEGLMKIVLSNDIKDNEGSQKYSIKFKGRMKKIIPLSEEEKIKKEKQRTSSRNYMRRFRGTDTKSQLNVAEIFPRKELSKKLNEILYYVKYNEVKNMIYDILSKDKSFKSKELLRVYRDIAWAESIREFMDNQKDFKKEGEVYFRIQR
ncbi:MAG: hypothetical protein ACP5NZ_00495 [Nanobdellota archaeon]